MPRDESMILCIAVKVWERTWDWENRDEGIAIILAALREYASHEVSAERERCAKIAESCAWSGDGKRIAVLIRGSEAQFVKCL